MNHLLAYLYPEKLIHLTIATDMSEWNYDAIIC